MKLISPLSLFFLSFIPLLLLIYLLKIKRTDVFVPSITLWQKIARDVQVQKPWQRLIFSLLLIIQIVILALFSVVIAKPAIIGNKSGKNMLIIIDTSASMAATDVSPNRLEHAKKKALDIVGDLSKNSRVTLISCSNKANVLSISSNDHSTIEDQITGLNAGGSPTNLSNALLIASGIMRSTNNTEVILISDGTGLRQLDTDYPVRFIKIGRESDNISFKSIEYKASRTQPDKSELFVSVLNNGDKRKNAIVATYDKSGRLIDAKETLIDAGKVKNISFLLSAGAGDEVALRLQTNDKLKDDNEAWAFMKGSKKPKITIYTEKNLFLEQAFKLFTADIKVIKPADWNKVSTRDSDLSVFDNFTPPNLNYSSNLLFINPPSGNQLFNINGDISPVKITNSDPASLLTADVDLSNVNILKAKRIGVDNLLEAVVESTGGPLIAVGEKKGKKFIVLPFDLHDSDFPLNYSFPIFIANIIDYFSASDSEQQNFSPGDVFKLQPVADKASIKDPSGQVQEFDSTKSAYYNLSKNGVHEVTYYQNGKTAKSEKIGVALVNSAESNISPTDLHIVSGSTGKNKLNDTIEALEEIWKPLSILILALLMIEWLVYLRDA